MPMQLMQFGANPKLGIGSDPVSLQTICPRIWAAVQCFIMMTIMIGLLAYDSARIGTGSMGLLVAIVVYSLLRFIQCVLGITNVFLYNYSLANATMIMNYVFFGLQTIFFFTLLGLNIYYIEQMKASGNIFAQTIAYTWFGMIIGDSLISFLTFGSIHAYLAKLKPLIAPAASARLLNNQSFEGTKLVPYIMA